MPELPEVETIRRDLLPYLIGRTFERVDLYWPGVVKNMAPEEFQERLIGQAITDIGRRGKYLLFDLCNGDTLVIHLKMAGSLILRSAGDPPDPSTRAIFYLDNGDELRFTDRRKFGAFWLVEDRDHVVGNLGPEPFDDIVTPQGMAVKLAKRNRAIKTILLDQNFIAGIGNIYADEALYEACIHPMRKGRSLSAEEVERLYEAILSVLKRGIANRGTTLRDYRDAKGRSGENQEQLLVFRRTGQPCPRCGTPIQRMVIGGRSSHFCPRCQSLDPSLSTCRDKSLSSTI